MARRLEALLRVLDAPGLVEQQSMQSVIQAREHILGLLPVVTSAEGSASGGRWDCGIEFSFCQWENNSLNHCAPPPPPHTHTCICAIIVNISNLFTVPQLLMVVIDVWTNKH